MVVDCVVDKDGPPNTSHHFPVIYSLCSSLACRKLADQIPTRRLRNFRMDDFKQDLSESLNQLTGLNSFNEKYSLFQEVLSTTYDLHAPLVLSKIRHNVRPKWMDHDYVLERARRRKLERRFKRTKSSYDEIQFNIQRSKCSLLSDKKRGDFYSSIAQRANGNTKTLFNLYEKLVGNTSSKSTLPDVDEYGSSYNLATSFNNYFVDKVKKTQNYINNENQSMKSSIITTSVPSDVPLPSLDGVEYLTCFKPSSISELKEIVLKYGVKTTHLIDPLSSEKMSESLDVLLPSLLDLVNTSLLSGSIDGVKFSYVKPLLKKVDMDCSELSSYRPISNLSFVSKIIERVVAKRLDEHK